MPFPIPHDLSSRENCHSHIRQKSSATVPRPLSSSLGNVPVQARPKRKLVHHTLHTILQFFGESCNLAVVEHLDLRGQELDDLGTSEVPRDSILSCSLPRILSHKNRSSWHHLSTDASNIVDFSDTATESRTRDQGRARKEHGVWLEYPVLYPVMYWASCGVNSSPALDLQRASASALQLIWKHENRQ